MKKINSILEFEKIVSQNKRTICYFYSNICIDCISIKNEIHRLDEEFKDYNIISIERSEFLDLFKTLNVFGIPSIIIFENNKIIKKWIDKYPKSVDEIVDFIKGGN